MILELFINKTSAFTFVSFSSSHSLINMYHMINKGVALGLIELHTVV